MATTIWKSIDGDMSAAASWTNGVPGAGDTAIANGRLSQVSMTNGLVFGSSWTLITTPEYEGDVGLPGSPLVRALFTGRDNIRGSGRVYVGTNAITQSVVDSVNLIDAFTSATGTIGRLYVKSGHVTVGSKASAGGTSWLVLDGRLARVIVEEAASGSDMYNTVRVNAGKLENARDFEAATDVMIVNGGLVRQTGLIKSTMFVFINGGILEYAPKDDPTAEAPYFFIEGGTLDIRASEFTIPVTQVEVGTGGDLLGNAIDRTASFYSLDLRDEYP